MGLNTPEPAPIPRDTTPMWELVIADMKERNAAGTEKYGTPLQAHNGRRPLVDAYQELLDLCVYLKQAIHEQNLGAMALPFSAVLKFSEFDAMPRPRVAKLYGVTFLEQMQEPEQVIVKYTEEPSASPEPAPYAEGFHSREAAEASARRALRIHDAKTKELEDHFLKWIERTVRERKELKTPGPAAPDRYECFLAGYQLAKGWAPNG